MNLSEALKSFSQNLENSDKSSSTITAYSKDIQQLNKYLERKENTNEVGDITTEMLNNYVEEIKTDKKRKYTLKTVSRKINSMKTFFKYLRSKQAITSDPASKVKHPKYEVSPPRVLTKLEYRALRDVARTNQRLYTIVEILLQTGIRIGELARLKLDAINLDSNQKNIKIREYGSNESRTVEINDIAEIAIKNYLNVRPQPRDKVNSLFITKTGNPLLIRNIRTSITRAFEKAGINDATVNDIRNTFIVHQLRNGMPVEIVGNIVGHKRITSTKKYLQFIDQKPKRKSKKITPL